MLFDYELRRHNGQVVARCPDCLRRSRVHHLRLSWLLKCECGHNQHIDYKGVGQWMNAPMLTSHEEGDASTTTKADWYKIGFRQGNPDELDDSDFPAPTVIIDFHVGFVDYFREVFWITSVMMTQPRAGRAYLLERLIEPED